MTDKTLADSEGRLIVPNFIDGKPIILPASASFPVISSRDEKIFHYGQTATVEVATQAVETAARTFKTYKHTPVHKRRSMLLRVAELLEIKANDLAKIQLEETNCPESWARATWSANFIHEAAASINEATKGEILPSHTGNTTLVFKEPVGPVLVIPPWNAAVVLAARGIASALAAGCTVVVKASELCPGTHEMLVEIFHQAGFPPGALNLVMADRSAGAEITNTIIAHPAIRKVEFIGSANVGKIIASYAAKHLKPVLLELGDQSPAIVLDDADLPRAAKLCAMGAVIHHGQVCFSTERIIVQSSVMKEFIRLLIEAVKDIPDAGVAVSRGAARTANEAIQGAIQDGAKFLYGSSDMASPASLAPSILTNVDRESTISTNEAFGPTAFVKGVETEEEAVEEANSRAGGLSASIFTQKYERGLRIARELEFGGVQLNNVKVFAEPTGPVTGTKSSGWGSNGGRYGIEEFVFNKCVSLAPSTKHLTFSH